MLFRSTKSHPTGGPATPPNNDTKGDEASTTSRSVYERRGAANSHEYPPTLRATPPDGWDQITERADGHSTLSFVPFRYDNRDRSYSEIAMRYMLYSHDTYGLGHLRRVMRIAAEIVHQDESAHVLIVTGSPRANSFGPPKRCRCCGSSGRHQDSRGRLRDQDPRGEC